MALKILQPNLTPAGQYDLHKDYDNIIKGGECAMLEANAFDGTDAYASDSAVVGPKVSVVFGKAGHYQARDASNSGASRMVFLADDGESEYGTLLGSIVGGTAGQGTGLGSMSSTGMVTVGPRSSFGSGKCTLFSGHGIYGVTLDVINITGLTTNNLLNGIGGHSSPTSSTGDGTWEQVYEPNAGQDTNYAAVAIGLVNDSSLVSTTLTHASGSPGSGEFFSIYFYDANVITKQS